jgi:hypothetical protein
MKILLYAGIGVIVIVLIIIAFRYLALEWIKQYNERCNHEMMHGMYKLK